MPFIIKTWSSLLPRVILPDRFLQLCKGVGGKVAVHQHRSPKKGRGLFAETCISQGEIILTETPVISLQDAENKTEALVCAHCLKHAGRQYVHMLTHAELSVLDKGTFEDQLHWYLLNKESRSHEECALLDLFDAGNMNLPQYDTAQKSEGFIEMTGHVIDAFQEIVYCACGAVYCSEECREAAGGTYHQYLCTRVSLDHRCSARMFTIARGLLQCRYDVRVDPELLSRFEEFCLQTNPSFYLAAQASCICLDEARRRAQMMPDRDLLECLRVATMIGALRDL